ncbi:4-hydroxybenzoate transporter [Paraburkholderia hospita]|uniref:4-hydroxybenzoate transporter n=1 Tax=Paraburkholderia hospita TaxID=169430 RepID=A0ABP2PY64_9BURK|nr:MFS transporter [Paraburkholderia hospita]EIN02749.1 4-hydroxybenzoate transporter [Paraburkholderia hospita]OUL89612.1 MFS transporter [Paraburkholderia hospita]
MNGSAITAEGIINARKTSGLQIVVLVMCFLVVAMDGFDVASVGYVAPLLKREWLLGPQQLGTIFAAGLVGLTVGSFVFGPLADRIGRKRTIVMSVVLFGLGSLLTSFATTPGWFIALRFLTGVGLGGGMPTAITLSSEYSPERHRPMLVTLMFCGFTIGLAFGGQLAALIMPAWGWRGVFVAGGVAPLVLAPLLWWMLPESLRFMLGKRKYEAEAQRVLDRLSDAAAIAAEPLTHAPTTSTTAAAPSVSTRPYATLFNAHYRKGTLLLWLAFFCTLWVYYQISSWLPSVLADSGMSAARAAQVSALLPVSGTVGALVNAALMRRMNPFIVLSVSYVVAAISIAFIGHAMNNPVLLAVAVWFSGLGLSGAQTGANVLVAGFYETRARATGVSWALGVGRVGSIIGSMTGGLLLALLHSPTVAFPVFAAPALVAAAAMLGTGWLYRTKAVH